MWRKLMGDYIVLKGKRYEIEESTWVDWDDGATLVHVWYSDPATEEEES
jgi:hypothetical protein